MTLSFSWFLEEEEGSAGLGNCRGVFVEVECRLGVVPRTRARGM
jgi:hypothetical protein